MKKGLLFLTLSIFGFALYFFVFQEESIVKESTHRLEIREKIAQIPKEDQDTMRKMFHLLMFSCYFPYTLYGDKPMSFESYMDRKKMSTMQEKYPGGELFPAYNQALEDGWNAWKKHSYLFPSTKYYLKGRESGDGHYSIKLLNKKAFLQVVKDNAKYFEEILNKKANPEEILHAVMEGRKLAFFDEVTLGIFLGYGIENAKFFVKRSAVMHKLFPGIFVFPGNKFENPQLDPIEKKQLRKKWKRMENQSCNLAKKPPFWPYVISLPGFVAVADSEETQHLKKKYKKQCKIISKTIKKGDVLEHFLVQFTSN